MPNFERTIVTLEYGLGFPLGSMFQSCYCHERYKVWDFSYLAQTTMISPGKSKKLACVWAITSYLFIF